MRIIVNADEEITRLATVWHVVRERADSLAELALVRRGLGSFDTVRLRGRKQLFQGEIRATTSPLSLYISSSEKPRRFSSSRAAMSDQLICAKPSNKPFSSNFLCFRRYAARARASAFFFF